MAKRKDRSGTDRMTKPDMIATSALIIGGLNWAAVALSRKDLVTRIVRSKYGKPNRWSRAVYGLVGAAAVYSVARSGARAVTN